MPDKNPPFAPPISPVLSDEERARLAAVEAAKAEAEAKEEADKKAAEDKAKADKEAAEANAKAAKEAEKASKKAAKEGEELKAKSAEEKKECLSKASAILAEYDGTESNIPVNHEYWGLMNRYRGL